MQSEKVYPYLLWDVDGTLLDFLYSQKASITKCLEQIGVTVTEELVEGYSRINDSWWKRLELGEVTKPELLTGRFIEFFAKYGITCPDIDAFREDYEAGLGVIFRCVEGSLELCRELKEKGFHQFVVTNGTTSVQQNKLKLSGFAELMEDVFISEQIGAPKPKKEFFDVCLKKIAEKYPDFDKSQALIIGDSLTSDMQGGENAGIDTCWYHPNGDEIPQIQVNYEIRELRDVMEIVS